MELYLRVRLARSEGMSRRQAAKQFNIWRDSVSKMLSYSTPPGYRRQSPIPRPKLDAVVSTIDHWLDEYVKVPPKQRHTAKRVFNLLRDECGFTGGYTIIKDYMRERDQRRQEVFVPLSHPSYHGQADFGEAMVVIGGVEQKAHLFMLDLPHSDGCYVRAYPGAVAEAWIDGHVHAFAFFGAVPQSIVYDNDRCLVAKILPDGTRKRATLFSGFLSQYLIRDRYGRPGKDNDKGDVEWLVGYARRNSWFRSRSFRHGVHSISGSRSNAVSVSATSCAARARRSENGCSAIWPPCAPCRRRRLVPATRPAPL